MTDQKRTKSLFREYAEAIAIALILALFIRTFVVQAFKIPSGSMEDTLLVGDHILVNKFIYGIKNPFSGAEWLSITEPHRNDVIVFRYPLNRSQDYIKRVIGIPGDKIKIVDKKVYVNGQPFDSGYSIYRDNRIMPGLVQPRDNFGPVIVPENSLFVMGDNRDNSYDSRFWKFVPYDDVRGKAFIIYWSWDKENVSVRWKRFGHIIH